MSAQDKPVKILLIEDEPADVFFLKDLLSQVKYKYKMQHVERLSSGIKLLIEDEFDIILLDLSLPDSQGLETFAEANSHAPDIPIIILTGLNDETVALEAVQRGAQDYLVKAEVDDRIMARSIRYAIERHKLQAKLRSLSLVDELTGLYNRRGFMTLAEQEIKLAHRIERKFLLLYLDLDNLKKINDVFGHWEGDAALVKVANVLRKTFRKSDVIARMGGDEFVVFAIEAPTESAGQITDRLQKYVLESNTADSRYELALSFGISFYDPADPCSIEELLIQSDRLMYEHKQSKRKF